MFDLVLGGVKGVGLGGGGCDLCLYAWVGVLFPVG